MKIKTVQKLTMGLLTPALVAAVLAGGGMTAQAAGHFTETFVVDESGEPLADEQGRYYLIADDQGRLQSGSASLQALFAERYREAEAQEETTPLINAATMDFYCCEGRFYRDAALTEEIDNLGRLLPNLVGGDTDAHTIRFADSGETLTVSASGDGFVGILTGFDGVGRRVFTASADGAMRYRPKLWFDEDAGILYADGAHSEALRTLPGADGLTEGEEALWFLGGSDRVIVLRKDADGAAGFLADAYAPSFREPLFTTDEDGTIRYLGSVTLNVEDGTSLQFFFNGDAILDGDLRVAGDVAALAPAREGMIFSGFYAYEGDVRIPLTNRKGVFDVDFDDPGFVAWRESVRQTLTRARVGVSGAAEYCYAFTFPAGAETVTVYSDGDAWYAEEQLAHEIGSLDEAAVFPEGTDGGHFAGFYLDGADGDVRRLTDGEGNFLLSAAEAIAALGGRGGETYARSYRTLTLTDGDDGTGIYYDGSAFYADDALLLGIDGVPLPAQERELIYDEEQEPAEGGEREPVGEIVRTCVGYYLADADGALLWEDDEPKVRVVGEDGALVFDFSGGDVPAGDVTAKAVWEEETILYERSGGAGTDDPQAPEKKTVTKDGDRAKGDEEEDAGDADDETAGDGGDPDGGADDETGSGAGADDGTGSAADSGFAGADGGGNAAGSGGDTGAGADSGSGSGAGTGDGVGTGDGAGSGTGGDIGTGSGTASGGTEAGGTASDSGSDTGNEAESDNGAETDGVDADDHAESGAGTGGASADDPTAGTDAFAADTPDPEG